MAFYLTLPSNSSQQYFPSNTLTHYMTKLPHAINLDGEWEVGLVEFQYPHSWYNVRKDDGWMVIINFNEEGLSDGSQKMCVDPGFYSSPEVLVEAINAKIKETTQEKKVQLHYNRITQKVTLEMEEHTRFAITVGMKNLLGFDRGVLSERGEASSVVDMNQGFYSLYVYNNLIQPRIVGDTHVSLMRIIPIKGNDGDFVTVSYENVHYLPLQQKSFDTLEMFIRDDTGQPVPFERGKVVTTLHFRKRRSSHFL